MRNPTVLVLLGLAVVWALVLTPDLVRMYRQTTSRRSSGLRSVTQPASRGQATGAISGFGPSYAGASASSNRSQAQPMSRTQAQQRRAMVLFALMVLCILTLMGGVIMGGSLWVIHLCFDVALVGYVYLLAGRARNQRASNAQRASRAARRSATRRSATRPSPSYLQLPAMAAQGGGAIGEVFYLDDARPGNAVAGYVDDGYSDEPAAYYDDASAPVASYEAYVAEAEYYETASSDQSGYYDEWAEPQQPLRRSVGW